MNNNIIIPNASFDFSKLSLAAPIAIQGGAYCTKLLYEDGPIYIQAPKGTTRQGFMKTGKKIYSDLMFNNTDEEFIQWIENLETKCIEIANKNKLLSDNELISLKSLSKQRNYLSHNLYSLFSDLIDESILEKYNLLDSDVHLYIERASQLSENLNYISDVISAKARD